MGLRSQCGCQHHAKEAQASTSHLAYKYTSRNFATRTTRPPEKRRVDGRTEGQTEGRTGDWWSEGLAGDQQSTEDVLKE